MQYRQAGRTDLQLSVLGLGSMTMGWSSDEATSFEIMDAALAVGINFIDSADIYSRWVEGNPGGVSETIIGNWMRQRGTRQQMIIATKCRGQMWEGEDGEGLSRRHIMRAAEDSLRRLQTDYIDLYQSHWPDEKVPYQETMRAFDDLVQQGKVRYIGCSNHTVRQLQAANQVAAEHSLSRYESLQPHYNLVHRREFEAELMALCQQEQIGVIPYSPLAGGFLTGKYKRDQTAPPGSRGAGNERMVRYSTEAGFAIITALEDLGATYNATPAQIALAWLLANPTVTSTIVGARSVEQLQETVDSVVISLSQAELAHLTEISNGF